MCFFIHLSLFTFLAFSVTEATNHLQYLNHSCSSNKTFTPNSPYQSNLHALLTSLSSHASTTQFYNTTASGGNATETIYGSFTCRGDVTKDTCQECVTVVTREIASSRCAFTKEAIVWYHECAVRYSNRRFFSSVDEWPRFTFMNYSATTNSTKEGSYGWLLANTLSDAVAEAANAGPAGTKKFATKNASLSASERVYTLVQCTADLSSQDCNRCLDDIMKNIPLCCLGKDCGMVLFPSCSLMFGIDQFYRDVPVVAHRESPPTSDGTLQSEPSGEHKARSLKFLIVVVPVIVLLMLFHGNQIRRINVLRRYKAILKENFGNEITTLESLRFDLATIEVATNKFSNENLIGRGGFGEVYKGILHDGRKIAVKRLSTCSRQGVIEFKNEVLLIAKLQHKNLVTLFGFCLQEKEKILVYEYVPNKSLDYFLFDSRKQRMLSWCERYRIIAGIARAILYLHEYSRVKIIHRDIKPSNILLDDDMNPKISDFGIARIIATNQDQEERTKRIVGTYGYMSPEYAMLGRFSEKSDIFSFGVLVLEIVTGKKNSSSYESYCNDGLLSYAWKQWRDGTPLGILDPNLCESCSEVEVIKCIHVGLLCVQQSPQNRPDMTMVVSCLSNISVELPFPREPAFFNIHSRAEANTMTLQLSSGHDATPYSINEMSISNSIPR